MAIHRSFIWIIIFFKGPFEYGDGGIFKPLRWMQNMHQSTWDHEILYGDRPLTDKQLSFLPLLRKIKNTNMADGWKLKFTFYFKAITREPLHLENLSFTHWKIMYIPRSFIWIIIFFDGAFEYGGGSEFWGYVGRDTELLCAKYCNFLQCRIFVSYLSWYF
jgi:hypothetical protein